MRDARERPCSRGLPRVMRPLDWAFPPRPVRREVLERLPESPAESSSAENSSAESSAAAGSGRAAGGPPPLLFVHGARHAAWCWEPWMEAAAQRGFAAYAVSLRGHGGSGGHERLRRTLLREYVHDVVQAAVRLPRQPVIVGHSLGALVVERALGRYPARAAALLAPASLARGADEVWHLLRQRPLDVVRTALGEPLPMTAATLFPGLAPADAQRHLARLGGESVVATYQATLPHRPVPTAAPVFVAGSPQDPVIPPSGVRRTADYYGVAARWYDGLGHDLMLDAGNEQVLADLLDWAEALT